MTNESDKKETRQQRNLRNTKFLAYWTGAWVLTMALANLGPGDLWKQDSGLTLAAIILNLLIGFGMIWANKVYLAGEDELHQKVNLEAMAVSLGVGLVVGLAYSNLDTTNVISQDAEISHLVIIMSLTYLVSLVIALRKYQ